MDLIDLSTKITCGMNCQIDDHSLDSCLITKKYISRHYMEISMIMFMTTETIKNISK